MHDAHAMRRLAEILKIAADPMRIEMLMTLRDGEKYLKDIIPPNLTFTSSAVSHHLAMLEFGGLIERYRDGRRLVVSLTNRGRSILHAIDTLVQG